MGEKSKALEERIRNLKEHVYKCAIRLIDQRGYRAVTLEDIAREAEVSRSTLHRYFPSKDDIILEFGINRIHKRERWLETITEEMTTDEALTKLINICVDDVNVHPEMAKFSLYAVYKAEALHMSRVEQNKGLAKVYEELLKRGVERGELPPDTDCYSLSYLFMFNFFSSLDKYFWDSNPGDWSIREYLLFSKDTILKGCMGR